MPSRVKKRVKARERALARGKFVSEAIAKAPADVRGEKRSTPGKSRRRKKVALQEGTSGLLWQALQAVEVEEVEAQREQQTGKTSSKVEVGKGQRRPRRRATQLRALERERQQALQVLTHPAFQEDAMGALTLHIRNTQGA